MASNPADHIAKIDHALSDCEDHLTRYGITFELERLYRDVIAAREELRALAIEVARRQQVVDESATDVGEVIGILEMLRGGR